MSDSLRYRTADALRRALDDRIVREARDGGLSPQRLRKEVVFERLLARLLVVSRERWVLKGGLALAFRLGAASRTTLDIDIARAGDEERATEDFRSAQRLDLATTSASRSRGRTDWTCRGVPASPATACRSNSPIGASLPSRSMSPSRPSRQMPRC
jgi:hypothetical protein